MIKATLSDGTILLGLSDMNIERLKAGEPMLFSLSNFGVDKSVLLMHGKTEQDIIDQFDTSKATVKTGEDLS